MTNYQNGTYFERRVLGILEAHGYHCVRSAGSHGVADIVAFKPGEVLFVQCKAGSGYIPLPEWNRLWTVAHSLSGPALEVVPLLATRDLANRVEWTRLYGPGQPRKGRPGEPWHMDRVAVG